MSNLRRKEGRSDFTRAAVLFLLSVQCEWETSPWSRVSRFLLGGDERRGHLRRAPIRRMFWRTPLLPLSSYIAEKRKCCRSVSARCPQSSSSRRRLFPRPPSLLFLRRGPPRRLLLLHLLLPRPLPRAGRPA